MLFYWFSLVNLTVFQKIFALRAKNDRGFLFFSDFDLGKNTRGFLFFSKISEINRPGFLFKGPARILEVGWDSFEKNPKCKVFSNTFFLVQLAIFGKKILQDTYLEMAPIFFQLTRVDVRRLRFSLKVHSKFQKYRI